jgi:SAM-dependent methyltransferase
MASTTQPPPHHEEEPAAALLELLGRLAPGTALDVACGAGRNALALARSGFTVEAWDRDAAALELLRRRARAAGLADLITARHVDLEAPGFTPPAASFATIAVFHYLSRPLAQVLDRILLPHGTLVYQTFVDHPESTGHAPRNPLFSLRPNELLTLFPGRRVLLYREEVDGSGRARALLLAGGKE